MTSRMAKAGESRDLHLGLPVDRQPVRMVRVLRIQGVASYVRARRSFPHSDPVCAAHPVDVLVAANPSLTRPHCAADIRLHRQNDTEGSRLWLTIVSRLCMCFGSLIIECGRQNTTKSVIAAQPTGALARYNTREIETRRLEDGESANLSERGGSLIPGTAASFALPVPVTLIGGQLTAIHRACCC